MKYRRGVVAGILALVMAQGLAGCAGAPAVPRAQVNLPPTWRLAETRKPLGPAPDLRTWWRMFHDPGLDQLVDTVLAQNLDLRAAQERLAAARAFASADAGRFRPGFGIQGGSTPTPGATQSYYQVNFDAQWELGLFGRATSSGRVAAGRTEIARADIAAARVAVVAECVRDYVVLRAAQRQSQLERQLIVLQRQKQALLEVRVREKLQDLTVLSEARAALKRRIADAAKARAAADIAEQKIALLIGRAGPPRWLQQSTSVPQPANHALQVIPADLLRTRPDVQRAEAQVLEAAGKAGIAKSNLYPHLSLGAGLSWSVTQVSDQLSTSSAVPFFGPVIDIPLFDWGERAATLRGRNHLLQAALIAYRRTVYAAVADTEIALARLHAARVRSEWSRGEVQSLGAAAKAAELRDRLGLGDGLGRTAAESARAEAELEASQADAQEGVAWVALYKALGGAALPEKAQTAPPETHGQPH